MFKINLKKIKSTSEEVLPYGRYGIRCLKWHAIKWKCMHYFVIAYELYTYIYYAWLIDHVAGTSLRIRLNFKGCHETYQQYVAKEIILYASPDLKNNIYKYVLC